MCITRGCDSCDSHMKHIRTKNLRLTWPFWTYPSILTQECSAVFFCGRKRHIISMSMKQSSFGHMQFFRFKYNCIRKSACYTKWNAKNSNTWIETMQKTQWNKWKKSQQKSYDYKMQKCFSAAECEPHKKETTTLLMLTCWLFTQVKIIIHLCIIFSVLGIIWTCWSIS